MAIKIAVAANFIGEYSDWTLKSLEMENLLYLSQMMFLGRYNEPLVKGAFCATIYGPRNFGLYSKIKHYSPRQIKSLFQDLKFPEIKDVRMIESMEEIMKHFGHVGLPKLVHLTQAPGGAWDRNFEIGKSNVIPREHIIEEYTLRKTGAFLTYSRKS